MTEILTYSIRRNLPALIINAGGLALVYFVPALSHLLGIPVYLFEPMRIMLFLSFVFTSRNNSYLLAVSLPLFSFLVSSHPSALKTGLITMELCANVYFFYLLSEKFAKGFITAFLSIALSKIFYYSIKYSFIVFALMDGKVISTPLYIQLIVTLLLSALIAGSSNLQNKKKRQRII